MLVSVVVPGLDHDCWTLIFGVADLGHELNGGRENRHG